MKRIIIIPLLFIFFSCWIAQKQDSKELSETKTWKILTQNNQNKNIKEFLKENLSNTNFWWETCEKIEIWTNSSISNHLETEVKCIWNEKVKKFKVDCWNWKIKFWEAQKILSKTYYKTKCEYTEDKKITYKAKCYVSSETTENEEVYTSNQYCWAKLTLWWNSNCWDGVIQIPNSDWNQEECEKYLESDWKLWDFPNFCDNNCKVKQTDNTSERKWRIIIPNEWEIIFWPNDHITIWHWMNPMKELWVYPFIKNKSSYEIFVDKLCVKEIWETLDWTSIICKRIESILKPWETMQFNQFPNYTWNKNNISKSESYWNNKLVTTIKNWAKIFSESYFAAELSVKVSKPSLVTTWWWISYIKDTSTISDISKISWEKNKNFAWILISTWTLSSHSNVINLQIKDQQKEVTNTWTTYKKPSITINNLQEPQLQNYNWMENIFILKWQNLELESIPQLLKWARTYIIEDGNLVINWNLKYSENIAFVVRWWDIEISPKVTEIDGIFLCDWGEIKWIWEETENTLIINGWIYWNLDKIINKRIQIKTIDDEQISIWTVINFNSQTFENSAPLIGKFLTEYISQ